MWLPALLGWPDEQGRRVELARAGIPRLLLVAEGTRPPTDVREDEDWVRLPDGARDIIARQRNLALRHRRALRLEDGVVRVYERVVALSSKEAAVLEVVLAHGDEAVSVVKLKASIGAIHSPDRVVYDVVHRLRTRLQPLGFDLFSLRSRGYKLGFRDDISG